MVFLFYSHNLVKEVDKQAKNGILTEKASIASLKTPSTLLFPISHQLPSHQMPQPKQIRFSPMAFLELPADGDSPSTTPPGELSSSQSTGFQRAASQSRMPSLCTGAEHGAEHLQTWGFAGSSFAPCQGGTVEVLGYPRYRTRLR